MKSLYSSIKKIAKSAEDANVLDDCIRKAVNIKYDITEKEENNLDKLAIISLKTKAANVNKVSKKDIKQWIKKHDCHQTSLAVKMKNLFIMSLEKGLNISFEDEDVIDVKNIHDISELVYAQLKGKKND